VGNYSPSRPDLRGSSDARRSRKRFLLSPDAGFGGNTKTVKCNWCPEQLTYETLTVDRYPTCGHFGGGYARKNIVPACQKCNSGRCRNGRNCRGGLVKESDSLPVEGNKCKG
jgi:hypothetical protein